MNDLPPDLQALRDAHGWEQRARLLMQLGNQLQALAPEERTDANRVDGCESQVWLVMDTHDGLPHFRADADARLIRGLLAVLLQWTNLHGSQALDLQQWFAQLGLSRHLSPSRSNGLNAVLERMRDLAGKHPA